MNLKDLVKDFVYWFGISTMLSAVVYAVLRRFEDALLFIMIGVLLVVSTK